jgi:HAD superfamily hydrolase (TIGR01509 family)
MEGECMERPGRIEAALFDFDGTLCDTEVHNTALLRDIFYGMGVPVTEEDLLGLAGGDDYLTVPPLLERYDARGTLEDYMRERDECYRTYHEADLAPEPGSLTLLEELRGHGVRVGLVSTTVSRCILTALNRLGMTGYFDAVICGDLVRRRKPAPDPYLAALDLLDASPSRAVVFEDSPTGIASGRAAGCYVFGYRGGSLEQNVSSADEVLDTFEGLEL